MICAPTWYPRKHIARADIPQHFRPWLIDPRSLTRRVRHACRAEFRLRLLDQTWGRPLQDEAMALAMPQGQLALVRHVFLLCAGKPWVFARSVIPPRTLRGAQRRLANLGARPLGAILFSDRNVRRGEVRVCELNARQPLFNLASAALDRPPEGAWARRARTVEAVRSCGLGGLCGRVRLTAGRRRTAR